MRRSICLLFCKGFPFLVYRNIDPELKGGIVCFVVKYQSRNIIGNNIQLYGAGADTESYTDVCELVVEYVVG